MIRENYKRDFESSNRVVADKFVSSFPNPFIDKENLLLVASEDTVPEGFSEGTRPVKSYEQLSPSDADVPLECGNLAEGVDSQLVGSWVSQVEELSRDEVIVPDSGDPSQLVHVALVHEEAPAVEEWNEIPNDNLTLSVSRNGWENGALTSNPDPEPSDSSPKPNKNSSLNTSSSSERSVDKGGTLDGCVSDHNISPKISYGKIPKGNRDTKKYGFKKIKKNKLLLRKVRSAK